MLLCSKCVISPILCRMNITPLVLGKVFQHMLPFTWILTTLSQICLPTCFCRRPPCSLFIPDSIQTLLSLYKPFYVSTCKIPPDPNNPPSVKLYLILQVNVNFNLPLYSHFALLFSDWLFLFFSDWLFIFHLIAKDVLFSFLLSSLIIHFLRARTLFFFHFCRKLHYFLLL